MCDTYIPGPEQHILRLVSFPDPVQYFGIFAHFDQSHSRACAVCLLRLPHFADLDSSDKTIRTPLFVVLVRDGFVYYSITLSRSKLPSITHENLNGHCVTAVSILPLALLISLPTTRQALVTGFVIIMPACDSVVGGRILLNMRGAIRNSDAGGAESTKLRTLTAMFPQQTGQNIGTSSSPTPSHVRTIPGEVEDLA